jgi:hypothetical protein
LIDGGIAMVQAAELRGLQSERAIVTRQTAAVVGQRRGEARVVRDRAREKEEEERERE